MVYTRSSREKEISEMVQCSRGKIHYSNSMHEITNGIDKCHQDDDPLKKTLLSISDMPAYLQFNRYIENGYRPLTHTWGCIKSLFTFHNETLNILTHGMYLCYGLINVFNLNIN